MRFGALGITLHGLLEISSRTPGLTKIVEYIATIGIGGHNIRIPVERLAKLRRRLIQVAIVLVDVAGEQRNIRIFREGICILRGQSLEFGVLTEVKEVIPEVDNDIAIMRKNFDCLATDFSGLPAVAHEAEVSFLLAQNLRSHCHIVGHTMQPVTSQWKVVGLDCSIHAARHNQGVLRSQGVATDV